jgi:hypothetical protein
MDMRKILTVMLLALIGCHFTPKQACDFRNGQRAMLGVEQISCEPPDSLQLCEAYCNSGGEDFSKVLQMSYGTCICDNSEGHKVADGYERLLNNKCKQGESK